jgi:hypothetical protein
MYGIFVIQYINIIFKHKSEVWSVTIPNVFFVTGVV